MTENVVVSITFNLYSCFNFSSLFSFFVQIFYESIEDEPTTLLFCVRHHFTSLYVSDYFVSLLRLPPSPHGWNQITCSKRLLKCSLKPKRNWGWTMKGAVQFHRVIWRHSVVSSSTADDTHHKLQIFQWLFSQLMYLKPDCNSKIIIM